MKSLILFIQNVAVSLFSKQGVKRSKVLEWV